MRIIDMVFATKKKKIPKEKLFQRITHTYYPPAIALTFKKADS